MRSWRAAIAMVLLGVISLAAGSAVGVAPEPASGSTPAVSVFPIPGSQVAPPGTQIVFRGINPYGLSSVQVTGSVTGAHSGSIQGDSDGNGGSFVPDQPFKPGEIVTVSTALNLVDAPSGAYQFRVADSPGPIPFASAQRVARAPGDVVALKSRPDLHPAALRMLHGRAIGGDLFLTPEFGPVQNGPMILDSHGRLVYFNPVPKGELAADFRVQRYQGNPVLTWFQGYSNAGVGVGQDEIYDSSYHQLAVVRASGGLSADEHEFLITPAGTALITAYYPVWWDASAIGGSKHQLVLDSVVQEIDIATGLLLFQWDSLDHVPVQASEEVARRGKLYDYFHVNSVEPEADGSLLISARNTWAIYKVSHSNGAVVWTLGGKRSTFKIEPGASFAFQHDARLYGSSDHQLTLFDDAAGPPDVPSRALRLRLDSTHNTATVVTSFVHSPPLRARYQGSVQSLLGGNELIGWGQQPYLTEFGRRGRVLMDARFVANTSSYRVYALPWSGQPDGQPDVAASSAGAATTVYASWNGSTQTAFWLVLSGSHPDGLRRWHLVRKSGFETAVRISRTAFVQVKALDSHGRVQAVSAVVKTA